MRTRFSQEARHDLRGIVREIVGHSPRGAQRVRNDISRLAASLAENPAVGPGSLRRVVVSPYLFYKASFDAVTIVRVLHGARDLDRALRENDPIEPDA